MIRIGAAFAALLLAAASAEAADATRGKAVFQRCAPCHGAEGAGSENGPSLVGVIGRKAGTVEGFRYSPPMKRSGLTWDEATLTAFVADPQAVVKGTRMPFDGLKDPVDAADVVAYLATLR
jgi:cytochrome c